MCDCCIYSTAFIARKDGTRGFNGYVWCNLQQTIKAPEQYCSQFHCFQAVKVPSEYPTELLPNRWCPNYIGIDVDALTQDQVETLPEDKINERRG